MERVKYKLFEDDELTAMLYEIASEDKIKVFEETGDVDFAYEIPGLATALTFSDSSMVSGPSSGSSLAMS